jgi:hypothetical protein
MANFRFSVGYQKKSIKSPSKWLENHPESPTFHLADTIRQLMEMVNGTATTMVNKPRSMASGGV